jgi:hypothetical protein
MFQLYSDTIQTLKTKLFGPGWVHLGTARIPGSNWKHERYFMLLMNATDSQCYIEEYVDAPEFFKRIDDDRLWADLYRFFYDKGLITMGLGQEKKLVKKEA